MSLKKFLCALLSVQMLTLSLPAFAADTAADAQPADYVLGDIDGNTQVNIHDALLLFQHSLMPDTYPITYEGGIDFTGDGAVSIDDALALFKYSMMPDLYPLPEGGEVEPETDEPETNAPETNEPETDEPETNAPETDEPETEEPDDNPAPINHLSINGTDISEYVIVSNMAANTVMSTAASELQKYINLSTGITLPIRMEASGKRILIDDSTITDDDSMAIYTDEQGLVLSGTARRSALYAVYHFLENCLNWRFFASDTEVCYEVNRLDLSDINIEYTLPYEVRGIADLDFKNVELSVKRYQNEEGQRRMSTLTEWGCDDVYSPNGIHTFGPLNESGDGYGDPQPCLNDPTVRQRMLTNIRKWLDENWGNGKNAYRDIKAIHISQNDNAKYCGSALNNPNCPECNADLETYGTPAGSIIEFVNWVAEDLETYQGGKYKDVYVITYAYQYSFDCPSNIECHDKVMIQYGLIDMCYQHSIDDPNCKGVVEHTPAYDVEVRSNVDVKAEMEKWKEICSNVMLLDYGLNCRYFLSPFPNITTLLENYRYFYSIGLWGYIVLSNPDTQPSEFGALRSYLQTKLTENPLMTEEEYETHINEFIAAYYGENAAPYIRAYLDYLEELANENDACFGIYNSPEQTFGRLNDTTNPNSFVSKSDWLVELFNNALAAEGLTEAQRMHITYLKTGCEYLRLGAVHQSIMTGSDYPAQTAHKVAVRSFYMSLSELGQTLLTESVRIPNSINFTNNPRTWINNTTLHWYTEELDSCR